MPSVRGPLPASEERDRGLISSEQLGWGVALDDAGRIAEANTSSICPELHLDLRCDCFGICRWDMRASFDVSPVAVEVVLPRLSGLSTAVVDSQV